MTLQKEINAFLAAVIIVGAAVGAAIALGGVALFGPSREQPPAAYVPCEPVQAVAERSAPPAALPCPPAESSAANPVLVVDDAGMLHLAYFERGRWRAVDPVRRAPQIVWEWRWP